MYWMLLAAVVAVLAVVLTSYRYVARNDGQAATSTVTEPRWVRWVLMGIALTFMLLFLVLPLLAVFVEAFRKGWSTYVAALTEPSRIDFIAL